MNKGDEFVRIRLSGDASEGLCEWAFATSNEHIIVAELTAEQWSWILYLLYESKDRAEWFPKGKSATIQHISMQLQDAARSSLPPEVRR